MEPFQNRWKKTSLRTIAQNDGEAIHFGNVDTTVGVGGSISSTEQYDSIELLCTVRIRILPS